MSPEPPRSVRRARIFLIGSAAAGAAAVILNLAALARVGDAGPAVIRSAAADDIDYFDPREFITEIRGILHFSLLAAVVGVVLLIGCAVAVLRRAQRARYAILAIAVLVVGLTGLALTGSPETYVTRDDTFSAALNDAIGRLVPGWYPGLNSVVSAIQIIGLVAAFVYLLRADVVDHYNPGDGPVMADLSDVLAARNERRNAAAGSAGAASTEATEPTEATETTETI